MICDKHRDALQRHVARVAEALHKTLPKGLVFVLLMADVGPDGNLAYASDADRGDVMRVLYEWLEHAGREGMGAPLEPSLREAIALMRATLGRGLTSGALTPARALAMGAMGGIAFARGDDPPPEEIAAQTIAFLEMAIEAESVADAELAAERQGRRS